MQLFKDTHLVKLELLSNATTIDSALNYIRSKQQTHHQEKSCHWIQPPLMMLMLVGMMTAAAIAK
jgi:hypothetical protein